MNRSILILPILAVMIGCGRQNPEMSEESIEKTVAYETLPTNAVLYRVNGVDFTKGDLEEEVYLRINLNRMRTRGRDLAQEKRLRMRLERGAEGNFINEQIFNKLAGERGVSPEPKDIADLEKRVATAFGRESTYQQFLGKLSRREAAVIVRDVDKEVLAKNVRERVIRDMHIRVPMGEVVARRNDLIAYNKDAVATNAIIYAQATNMWRQISSGKASYEDFVARHATSKSRIMADAEWGAFPLEAFKEEPALQAVVSQLKLMGVSAPVEGDNGLMIVRLIEIQPEDKAKGRPTHYKLSRIFFELPEIWEPVPDETLAAQMRQDRERKAWERFYADLRKGAKVEYPSGKIQFAWQNRKPRKPMPEHIRKLVEEKMKQK